jgi:hypothetical protein
MARTGELIGRNLHAEKRKGTANAAETIRLLLSTPFLFIRKPFGILSQSLQLSPFAADTFDP